LLGISAIALAGRPTRNSREMVEERMQDRGATAVPLRGRQIPEGRRSACSNTTWERHGASHVQVLRRFGNYAFPSTFEIVAHRLTEEFTSGRSGLSSSLLSCSAARD
jgi:hypothetical protein